MTRRAGVLGSPIRHSLSPVLHRAAYAHLGLTGWAYDAHEVDAAGLPGFLAALDASWAGLSLTMPLKAAVLPLLDEVSPLGRRVAAVNTVVVRDDRLLGENTDVPGLAAVLAEAGADGAEDVVVLGAGATARSAVAALAGSGCRVTAYARSPGRAESLAATAAASGVDLEVSAWSALSQQRLGVPVVVQTAPAGAADTLAAEVPARPGLLVEALYEPWPTPLAQAWAEAGGQVVGGLELLVHQAVRQVGLFTGAAAEGSGLVPVLRAAGAAALAGR